jgi:hypothetical protein
LTLLIGLLLGHWATGDQSTPAAATPAPQVIKLEGAAAPATAAAAGAASDTPGGSSSGSTSGKGTGAKAKNSTASEKAKAPKGAVSVDKLNSKKAVDDAVKKGKPISTGSGTLPPKDDKPAGNGTTFEEIG